MKRFLQNYLLTGSIILTFSYVNAQQDRIKTVKTEQVPFAAEIKESAQNPSVKKETYKETTEFKKAEYTLKKTDTLPGKQSITKVYMTDAPKTTDKVIISENVTYEKEVLPEPEKVISAEKSRVKVTSSVNYKPKTVKEDIHPVVDYSTAGITSDKRIYLEQEAKDLEREILQNTGKSDYDLVQKQKQLDDIRKMLQK